MAPYELAQTSAPGNGRAVVLGGGLAGLLAARVLADWFEEVMIIERHNSPVAQQVLPQVLSDAARTQLDQLFTGLSSELVAHGAANAVPASRPNLTTASTPRTKRADARLQFTQRFVHRHLSRRLDSFDGVMMQDGCDAVGLVSGRGRCISVHVLPRSHSAAARTIPADLVVDAMGAGSRLYLWVDDLWRIHVPSDRQMITHYASRLYQLSAGSLPTATTIDRRSAQPYGAAVMAVENGQCVVTVADPNIPNIPPCDGEEFDGLLRDLLPQRLAATLAGGQPAGPVIMFASARIRRRFDDANRLPLNVVAIGDSLCSLDPLDGRGFEAAVLEAGVLSLLLGEHHPDADNGQPIELPRRYFRAAAKLMDGAWVYRERHRLLWDALGELLPRGYRLLPAAAGLHITIVRPELPTDRSVWSLLESCGFLIGSLRRTYRFTDPTPGFLVGFGALPTSSVAATCRAFAETLERI